MLRRIHSTHQTKFHSQTHLNKFRQIHVCICQINFSFTEKYSTQCHRGTSVVILQHTVDSPDDGSLLNNEKWRKPKDFLFKSKNMTPVLISQENMKEIYLFVLKDTNLFHNSTFFLSKLQQQEFYLVSETCFLDTQSSVEPRNQSFKRSGNCCL